MRLLFFTLFTVAFSLTACKKNDTLVPLVQVDLEIYLNNPAYLLLNQPTGWVYVQGGSKGIVVYRSSIETFKAFDRHSPYEVENQCIVDVDSTGFTLTDPCSNSVFLIADGSVSSGPSTAPLKEYQTFFDASNNVLRITN